MKFGHPEERCLNNKKQGPQEEEFQEVPKRKRRNRGGRRQNRQPRQDWREKEKEEEELNAVVDNHKVTLPEDTTEMDERPQDISLENMLAQRLTSGNYSNVLTTNKFEGI